MSQMLQSTGSARLAQARSVQYSMYAQQGNVDGGQFVHHALHNMSPQVSAAAQSGVLHSLGGKGGAQMQMQQQCNDSGAGSNSIDEHVQSAIDSILNLQQNTSLDLDEAVSSILS